MILGTCNGTAGASFECFCQPGWTGRRCESKINYCENVTCLNNGVCRPLLLDYTCECLGESFSGRNCELVATTLVTRRIVSKSFGYVSGTFIGGVLMFIIVMDVLKYCFGIDPVKDQRVKLAKRRNHPPIVRKFVYVDAPPPETSADEV